jgi:hypothetical protein
VAKAYLIDMDGVLVTGTRMIPGADAFIKRLQDAQIPSWCSPVSRDVRTLRSFRKGLITWSSPSPTFILKACQVSSQCRLGSPRPTPVSCLVPISGEGGFRIQQPLQSNRKPLELVVALTR